MGLYAKIMKASLAILLRFLLAVCWFVPPSSARQQSTPISDNCALLPNTRGPLIPGTLPILLLAVCTRVYIGCIGVARFFEGKYSSQTNAMFFSRSRAQASSNNDKVRHDLSTFLDMFIGRCTYEAYFSSSYWRTYETLKKNLCERMLFGKTRMTTKLWTINLSTCARAMNRWQILGEIVMLSIWKYDEFRLRYSLAAKYENQGIEAKYPRLWDVCAKARLRRSHHAARVQASEQPQGTLAFRLILCLRLKPSRHRWINVNVYLTVCMWPVEILPCSRTWTWIFERFPTKWHLRRDTEVLALENQPAERQSVSKLQNRSASSGCKSSPVVNGEACYLHHWKLHDCA